MRKSSQPLSIGLPVYNGENFLEQTLDSLMVQTYSDFEIVISDNASTDNTQEICEGYAMRDSRIRYYRQNVNVGAAENYNFVFRAAEGKYFKWAAHDDLFAPSFLERCIEILEEREDVVLVFTLGQFIDEKGAIIRTFPSRGKVDAMSSSRRFCSMIVGYQPVFPVFGVARTEVLARTKLIGKYTGSDRPLIGELSLRGNLYEIPEHLFYYRVHQDQSWGGRKSNREQQAWYDPSRADKHTFPTWRLLLEHERTIWRVPMGIEQRLKMHWIMAKWVRSRWRPLLEELAN